MRIISKFKDYYDGAQSFGTDDDLTYVRHTETHEFAYRPEDDNRYKEFALLEKFMTNMPKPEPFRKHTFSVTRHLVAFCGKLYPFVEIDGSFFSHPQEYFDAVADKSILKNIPSYVYKDKALKSHIETVNYYMNNNSSSVSISKFMGKFRYNAKAWDAFVSGLPDKLPIELFLKASSPIIVLTCPDYVGGKRLGAVKTEDVVECEFNKIQPPTRYSRNPRVTINPRLDDIEFARVVDPFTAYQEIDMFLSNQMVDRDTATNTGSDKIIRDSKGFDDKSFKNTAPSTKKARRRANKKLKAKLRTKD